MNFKLTDKAKNYLLKLARQTILSDEVVEYIPEELNFNAGCFVTLHLNGNLRGCIGTFSADNCIYENVKEMARAAAFHDPRFKPLKKEEVDLIKIEITVLSPMVEAKYEDIIVGRDGLYVKHHNYSGVLLPQVPVEHNWDKATFLSQTCIKAGLPNNFWKTQSLEIYRFEGHIFSEK